MLLLLSLLLSQSRSLPNPIHSTILLTSFQAEAENLELELELEPTAVCDFALIVNLN